MLFVLFVFLFVCLFPLLCTRAFLYKGIYFFIDLVVLLLSNRLKEVNYTALKGELVTTAQSILTNAL